MHASINACYGYKVLNVVHVCAGLPPHGGIGELVPWLALAQHRQGCRVTLVSLGERTSRTARLAQAEGVKLVFFPISFPKSLYFSWCMLSGMWGCVREADLIHVYSSWTFPVWWGCLAAWWQKKALVISPQGSLDPVRLKHSRWKKKCVGWVDRWCLRHAVAVVASARAEQEWIDRYVGGTVLSRIRIVPNGIADAPARERRNDKHGAGDVRRILYLGRLHPLKGLDMLLSAWEHIRNVYQGKWQLIIAGPDEQGTLAKLHGKTKGNRPHVTDVKFAGAVEGIEKYELIRAADIFVSPTRSENFGIVVGEALGCGVPVVVTKGAPWEKIEEVGCGYWVDVSVEGIADGLLRMMQLSDEQRQEMGKKGREWVAREFAWEHIAAEMINVYRSVLV